MCITRLVSGKRLFAKERMTRAAIEPAVPAGKPKKFVGQTRDVAPESLAFVRHLRDYGAAGSE